MNGLIKFLASANEIQRTDNFTSATAVWKTSPVGERVGLLQATCERRVWLS